MLPSLVHTNVLSQKILGWTEIQSTNQSPIYAIVQSLEGEDHYGFLFVTVIKAK